MKHLVWLCPILLAGCFGDDDGGSSTTRTSMAGTTAYTTSTSTDSASSTSLGSSSSGMESSSSDDTIAGTCDGHHQTCMDAFATALGCEECLMDCSEDTVEYKECAAVLSCFELETEVCACASAYCAADDILCDECMAFECGACP